MNPEVLPHYESVALHAMESRHRLGQWLQAQTREPISSASWRIDPDTRKFMLGHAAPVSFELLATVDSDDQSLLWSWANPSVNDPKLTIAASVVKQRSQELSLHIFTHPTVQSSVADPMAILAIAQGWTGADAGYAAAHAHGWFLLLLRHPSISQQTGFDALGFTTAFQQLINAVPVNHQRALNAWLARNGLPQTTGPGGSTINFGHSGQVRVVFDDLSRCTLCETVATSTR